MPSHALASTQGARVEALKARHAALSVKIEREQSNLSVSDRYLRELKRQKLEIKEVIEGIREAS